MTNRNLFIVIGVLALLILVMGGVIVYGVHQQTVADAAADATIKAEKEARERVEKERNAEREETKRRIDDLENRKKEPATAAEVAAMLAPYMSKGQQPIVIEHKDEAGKTLPNAPSGLLYEGRALTDLRNRELTCQQCETQSADDKKEIKQKTDDVASLQRRLDASEKARKKSKWRKVGDAGVKIAIFVAGVGFGKATK